MLDQKNVDKILEFLKDRYSDKLIRFLTILLTSQNKKPVSEVTNFINVEFNLKPPEPSSNLNTLNNIPV